MGDYNFLTGGIYTIGSLDIEDGTNTYLVINQDEECVYFHKLSVCSGDLHDRIREKIVSHEQAVKELSLYINIPAYHQGFAYKYLYFLNNRPYLPQGGEVVGYLGQVSNDMIKDLKKLIKNEYNNIVRDNLYLQEMLNE